MDRYWLVLFCLVSVFLCAGCENANDGITPDRITEVWTPTANTGIIQISTAEDFVKNIGPNRTLELAPGEYVISEVSDRCMDFVRWDPNFDGKTLTIRKVQGLRIVGKGDKPVRLIVRPRYVFVLNFENCKDIELENLVLGHSPEEGYCDSGVLGAANCENISIRKSELFGCGTEGLTLRGVRNLSFEDSVIRDCSYGIMTIQSCADLNFTGSRFIRNREYYGLNLHDSKGIVFDNCLFRENKVDGKLFQATSCSDIVVTGCEISENQHKGLTDNFQTVRFRAMKE